MDIFEITQRAANTNGDIYSPFYFVDDDREWTDEEMEIIESAISPFVPEKVDAMFNTWMFTKYKYGFFGKRSTWDMGIWSVRTIEELVSKIENYYQE